MLGSRVLFVVSATLPNGPVDPPNAPRKDWTILARTLDATVLDRSSVGRSIIGRLVSRFLGVSIGQAWIACTQRHKHDLILTDGEHVGIPLALLLKLIGTKTRHVTIGHRLTAAKKRIFFRWFRVHTHIDRIAVHARRQLELAVAELGIPAGRIAFVPYCVDTDFWRPRPVAEERLICSAGLEFRDYPVLMRAVDGLDAHVVIGAASHWSKRQNSAAVDELPANVKVDSFDYHALRELYARAAIVVVPLTDVDFQAGITTILEAMAMGKPVIVTATAGQTDVVQDRRRGVRGMPTRPISLLERLADQHGIDLESNGMYVPPDDPVALRRAIVYLLDHPAERARLGAAGRRMVEQLLTVDQFADRIRALVEQACSDWESALSDHRAPAALGTGPATSP
jgi:glycosyltransferase involved in cell wall biosynthesis